jgi:ABC-type lipoprotein release transport system permease subunit
MTTAEGEAEAAFLGVGFESPRGRGRRPALPAEEPHMRNARLQRLAPVLGVVCALAIAVVALVAGLVAAILPARRASRLNVLEALQYE